MRGARSAGAKRLRTTLVGACIVFDVEVARLPTLGTVVVTILAETDGLIGMTEHTEAVTPTLGFRLFTLLANEGHRSSFTIASVTDSGNEKSYSLFALR